MSLGRGRAVRPRVFATNARDQAWTVELSPSEGSVSVVGGVASVLLIVAAISGAVTVGGNAPSLTAQLSPASGAAVAAGAQPSATLQIAAVTGAVVSSGNAPAIQAVLAAQTGVVTVDGVSPSLMLGISGSTGAISATGYEPTITGGATFPTQYAGFRVLKAGAAATLCLVAQADAPSGMGGVMKFRKGGVAYAVYLVETNDAHASAVRIKTATGIKAIRLAT